MKKNPKKGMAGDPKKSGQVLPSGSVVVKPFSGYDFIHVLSTKKGL